MRRGDRHVALHHAHLAAPASALSAAREFHPCRKELVGQRSAARADGVRASPTAARESRHGFHVGVRRAARHLAARAANVGGARLSVALRQAAPPPIPACRRAGRGPGSILPSSTWLWCMARRAWASGVGKSRSMISAPVCPMPSTMRLVLPQMCSRTGTPSAWMASISRCSHGSTNCAYSFGPTSDAAASPTPIRVAPAATCARANSTSMRTVNSKSASTNGGSSKKSNIRVLSPRKSALIAHGPSTQPSTIRVARAFRQQAYGLDAIAHAAGCGESGRRRAASLRLSSSSARLSTIAGGWSSNHSTVAPRSVASRAGSEIAET